ncbi:hypothetical protein OSTOST_19793 [Ostertagia ostertagi]
MVGGVRLLACGRLAVRAVFSASALDIGSSITTACPDPPLPKRNLSTAPARGDNAVPVSPPAAPVVASCAGFPKDMQKGPSTVLDSGVYGDDACFISRFKNTFVVGVADGVGGWRKYGIDPSEFSRKLMRECEKRVSSGDFDPRSPEALLEKAFKATAEAPRPEFSEIIKTCYFPFLELLPLHLAFLSGIIASGPLDKSQHCLNAIDNVPGSSTACVLVVHQEMLYSANLGDSGFMVVRNGRVLTKRYRGFIGDTPDLADKKEIRVQKGDIVLLATDGLWDNLTEQHVLDQLRPLIEEKATVQEVCNALALTARRLSFDVTHNSPFAVKAREHGLSAAGGKPDDITLVLLLIV